MKTTKTTVEIEDTTFELRNKLCYLAGELENVEGMLQEMVEAAHDGHNILGSVGVAGFAVGEIRKQLEAVYG